MNVAFSPVMWSLKNPSYPEDKTDLLLNLNPSGIEEIKRIILDNLLYQHILNIDSIHIKFNTLIKPSGKRFDYLTILIG